MKSICGLLLAISAIPIAFAQESQDATKPATKLEAFQAKTGIVVVRGFTTVGTIRGLAGDITVDAREFRDASNPNARVSGISISVKETDRLERENTSFIDADEVDSLLIGLDYIAKASKDITKLEQFEAEYRTKGNFSLTVFNRAGGQLSAAVSSGRIGKTTAYIKLGDLAQLRQLITSAKSKL
jgi:hypothetical protein